MANAPQPADLERIACKVCLKEIPRSEATISEAADYVTYFCGLACFQQWKNQPSENQPSAEAAKSGNEN